MSVSMLTLWPAENEAAVVTANVVGIRAIENAPSLTLAMVSEIPSMATEPLGIMYGNTGGWGLIHTTDSFPERVACSTVPVPST